MPMAVVDLPEPDSPMMVTVSPASMQKDTPSTARMTPLRGDQLDLQLVDLQQVAHVTLQICSDGISCRIPAGSIRRSGRADRRRAG